MERGIVWLSMAVLGLGWASSPAARAEPPPPFDPQNPDLLDWGRPTPTVTNLGTPGGPVERPLTAAEQRAAAATEAWERSFEGACADFDAGRNLAEACEVFRKSVDGRYSAAAYNYAQCLWYGRGAAVDYAAALALYRKAAKSYFTEEPAQKRLREILHPDSGAAYPHRLAAWLHDLEHSTEFAMEELRLAAGLGDTEARWLVAARLAGTGPRAEAERWMEDAAMAGDARAVAWWRSEADRGAANAKGRLAKVLVATGQAADAVRDLRAAALRNELAPEELVALAELLVAGRAKPARGEALTLYERAHAAGLDVEDAIASLYLDGKGGVPKDPKKGLALLEARANAGNADAMIALGARYEEGRGVAKSYAKALDWYGKPGASTRTYVARAGIYERGGHGVPRELPRACWTYRAALAAESSEAPTAMAALERLAAHGSADARCELGWAYLKGKAIVDGQRVTDLDRAWRLFQEGAASDHAKAGEAATEGHAKAGEAATAGHAKAGEAATAGHANSLYWLGWMSWEGKGTPQSYTEALRWHTAAAKLGFANSLYEIGLIHLEGLGVPTDLALALEAFRGAAEKGNAEGMYMVGQMIEQGQVGSLDLGPAKTWYERAAAAGSANAAQALQR